MGDGILEEIDDYIGPDLNDGGSDCNEIKGEDWINEMHRIQREEISEHSCMKHVELIAKDSWVAYQGRLKQERSICTNDVNNIDINDNLYQRQIALHEDEKCYRNEEEVFKDVGVLVQWERWNSCNNIYNYSYFS